MTTPTVTLRPATKEDARTLWKWANDPTVRASAFSQDHIPWENHVQWLHRKLEDPQCLIFIAENKGGTPVGQIRFDCHGRTADIDLHLSPGQRGKGLGVLLVTSGIQKLFEVSEAQQVHAYVKQSNVASQKTFERAGFSRVDKQLVNGVETYRFAFPRRRTDNH